MLNVCTVWRYDYASVANSISYKTHISHFHILKINETPSFYNLFVEE